MTNEIGILIKILSKKAFIIDLLIASPIMEDIYYGAF